MLVQGDLVQTGLELQRVRRFRGLTQQQLADLSTVSVRAIRDLELGNVRHPRRDTVRLLADALMLSGPRRAALELCLARDPVEGAKHALTDADGVPTATGPLLGRNGELARLVDLLSHPDERLVSLVGLAGVGKTRLAVEAAGALHERDDCMVLWVPSGHEARCGGDLTGPPRSVFASWVHQIVSDGRSLEALGHHLGDRSTLLVLDGYELDADLRGRIVDLLQRSPRLRLLSVSRVGGVLPDNWTLALAPLPDPAVDEAAVRLLLAEAERNGLRPDEASTPVIAEICRALDGVPLAVQGAASWLCLYPPRQLLQMAEDSPLALTDEHDAGGGLLNALKSSVCQLRGPDAELLRAAAAIDEPWGADRAVRLLRGGPIEAGRAVRGLHRRGLIRQVGIGGPHARFRVLNLIRHVTDDVCRDRLPRWSGDLAPAAFDGERGVQCRRS